MLADYPSVFEVDLRTGIRDAYYRWKDLDLGILLYPLQEVFAITGILVSKRQNLSCVEKAVFFSYKYNLIFNLDLNVSRVKIRYLDKD